MNFLPQNLKYLRRKQGLTQADFAQKVGINRSAVGAYEEGRAEPRLQNLLHIAHYFKVSIDDILNKDISADKDSTISPDSSGRNLRILPIAISETNKREMVTLVPVKAAAGYLQGYGDVDFIEALPGFDMPFPELPADRTYRVFQIQGESMLPVPSGAYVICEYVQDWEFAKNNQCHIVVSRDEGIAYKRLLNHFNEGEFELVSDNPEYSPYRVKINDILEIWKAVGIIDFHLNKEAKQSSLHQMAASLAALRADVEELKKERINR